MEYETIQPPFTKKFDEMSKTELKEYNRWFHQVLPERIQELVKAVKSTSGFEGWVPDFTPDSLYVLGDWLALQVETRQLSRAEYEQKYQEVNKGVRFPIDISDREMSIRTVSLAMDTGMYLSEVFLRNHATLSWTQTLKGGKRYIHYGRPALQGFGKLEFEPVHMMVVLASKLLKRHEGGRELREIYDIWAKMIG